MLTARRHIDIFVARASGRWVVRDADGNFWALPATTTPWDDREPFVPDEEAELEPVPGHYRYLLRLPADG